MIIHSLSRATAASILTAALILALLCILPLSLASAQDTLSFRVHLVSQGDTLRSIAAQPDRFGTPHLWTLIYGINREELLTVGIHPAEMPTAPLPEGTALAILTTGARDDGSPLKHHWTLNLISSKTETDLYAAAVALLDRGYLAYIVPAKGLTTDWLRLRVGLFADRTAAQEVGDRIIEETGMREFWITTEAEDMIMLLAPFLQAFQPARHADP